MQTKEKIENNFLDIDKKDIDNFYNNYQYSDLEKDNNILETRNKDNFNKNIYKFLVQNNFIKPLEKDKKYSKNFINNQNYITSEFDKFKNINSHTYSKFYLVNFIVLLISLF
jgi:hypothetical protein